jgi:hypothetical protein
MWFCAGWLLGDHFWTGPPGGLLKAPAVQLLDLFGTGGKLAAISVLCLLLGELTSALVDAVFFSLSHRFLKRITPETLDQMASRPWIFRPMSGRSMRRVRTRIRQEYQRHQEETTSDNSPRTIDEHEVDRLAIEALREVLFMSPRMIVAKPELYAEFSRIKAESQFRDAILLPLPVLAVAICFNINVPVWTKIVVLVATGIADCYLFAQARRQFRQAHSMVAHSVADGTISSAAMSDR